MKTRVLAFLLATAVAAFAQGRGGGHMGGPPAGAGGGMSSHGAGSSGSMGTSGTTGRSQTQHTLKQSQINSGAFRMLEKRTGMTSTQLQQMFASSGAKNFGQFVAAIVVSKNLGLDTNTLLTDLKTMSLGQALQKMGVSKDTSKSEIKKANQEIKDANKNG